MATNIAKFDHLTGKIFADLYESFPVPLTMCPEDYISTLLDICPPEDDSLLGGAALDAVGFYDATHQWLEKAGFIDVLSATLEGSTEVVLTTKGLEALKSMPDSLGGESLGDRLAQATRDGVFDQVRALTGQVLGAGVRMGAGVLMSSMG